MSVIYYVLFMNSKCGLHMETESKYSQTCPCGHLY